MSPYAEMLEVLDKLKQRDPTLYQRVKQEALGCLQAAARTTDAAVDVRQMLTYRKYSWVRSLIRRWKRIVAVMRGSGMGRASEPWGLE